MAPGPELDYPQTGRALVPPPLAEIFGEELLDPWGDTDIEAARTLRWRDLDERVWRLPPEKVAAIAELVVRRLGGQIHRVTRSEQPILDEAVPLASLDLPRRLENALQRRGYVRERQVLPLRLCDVALLPNVGARSLLLFLLRAEAVRRLPARRARGPRATPQALSDAAAALIRRRWTSEISSRDPRFGADITLLFAPAATAAEAARGLMRSEWSVEQARAKARQARALERKLERARSLSLGEELYGVLVSLISARYARALQRRFGWDGAPAGTLEVAAQVAGVSRERVRQVQARLTSRLAALGGAWTPVLDRALAVLGRCGGCDAQELARRLRARRISDRPFTRAALLRAEELFTRSRGP